MLSSENRFTRYRLAIPIAAILAIVAVLIFAGTSAAQTATLQTPQDLTVQSSSDTSMTITWTPVTGATHYHVRLRRDNDDEYIVSTRDNPGGYTFSPTPINGDIVTISGFTPGHTYAVSISAATINNKGKTIAYSAWSTSAHHNTGKPQTEPTPEPAEDEKGSRSQDAIRASTDIVAGTPFTADGYVFELIPHTEFIMAWVVDTDQNDNKGDRAPTLDINFSCVNASIIEQSKPSNLRYNNHTTDGYVLLYGASNPQQNSLDLVPNPAPPALTEENDFRRRRVQDCTHLDTRSDIVAFPNYLYTTNTATSVIEAWKLTERGTVFTRDPSLDIPLHSDARQHYGFNIFNDTAHSASNTDFVWIVHDFGTNDGRFIPHSRSTLRPIPDKSFDYNYLGESGSRPKITQIGDVFISSDAAYIQPLNALHFHEFGLTRADERIQIGTFESTIYATPQETQTNIGRSMTGYANIIFFPIPTTDRSGYIRHNKESFR